MLYDSGFLSRLEGAVRAALPQWGMNAGADVSLLTISENATFRVTDPALGKRVLRVHRPGYHSREEIASELAWIEALRAADVVVTPRPLPLAGGGLIADIADGADARHVVAFEFVEGHEPPEGENLADWFHQLGAIHARLHAHARVWARPEGFVRKVWNFDTTLGATPYWGDFRAALGLDERGRSLLETTAARLREKLAPLSDPDSFGLVHADLRLANLLVDGDRLALIDFDDCGFAWFLFDFAASISFLEREPYVPSLKAAWLDGYRTAGALPSDAADRIDLFVMLRRIQLTAWIASHAETPTAQAMGVPYTEGTLAMADDFLVRLG